VSDTSKRPGARDISDLKARLGLKKAAPAGGAPAPAAGGRTTMPPPGGRGGGTIPAPPGAQAPRPSIPDASHDPFGAMNAMAAHGAVAAQPQIVIVNDGQGVENVGHKRNGAKMAVYAAILLVPLILGSVLGKIAASNGAFNSAIADAGKLGENVKAVGKSLIAVQQVLQVARERGNGRFTLNDQQLIKDLEALTLADPSYELLTQIELQQIPTQVAQETIGFYRDATKLNALIREHIAKSKSDQKAFQAGGERAGATAGKMGPAGTFGALIALPSAEQAGGGVKVKLVQLGLPVCEDGKAAQQCPGAPSGYQYRLDETGPWGTAKLGVGDGQLVMLDQNSKVLEGLMVGGEASVTATSYLKRINDIRELLEGEDGGAGVLAARQNLTTMLQNISNRSTKPTFFL
jgi:hypothetical protein